MEAQMLIFHIRVLDCLKHADEVARLDNDASISRFFSLFGLVVIYSLKENFDNYHYVIA